jgi:hypothetical protein
LPQGVLLINCSRLRLSSAGAAWRHIAYRQGPQSVAMTRWDEVVDQVPRNDASATHAPYAQCSCSHCNVPRVLAMRLPTQHCICGRGSCHLPMMARVRTSANMQRTNMQRTARSLASKYIVVYHAHPAPLVAPAVDPWGSAAMRPMPDRVV